MYTIHAMNDAGAIGLGPYSVQDALRKVIDLRDEGFRNISLTEVATGIVVDIEQFMRNPPVG